MRICFSISGQCRSKLSTGLPEAIHRRLLRSFSLPYRCDVPGVLAQFLQRLLALLGLTLCPACLVALMEGYYFIGCAHLFAAPSSVGCLLGGRHFVLSRFPIGIAILASSKVLAPAQLSRCVVYGGHFWRRKMVGVTYPSLRAGARA